MKIFWFDEEVEHKGAEKYSKEAVLAFDASDVPGPVIFFKPNCKWEFGTYKPKKIWVEVYPEHHFTEYNTGAWANSDLTEQVGLISGMSLDVSLKIASMLTLRYNRMPKGAENASVLFINGPNLNLLGTREPDLYGRLSLAQIAELFKTRHPKLQFQVLQSNSEGSIVDMIHQANNVADAIVINAGAYTHTSVAIHDALRTFEDVIIEAHITNPHQREPFRHCSFVSPAADGLIAGFGPKSYEAALMAVMSKL